jgi:hypothetical protein
MAYHLLSNSLDEILNFNCLLLSSFLFIEMLDPPFIFEKFHDVTYLDSTQLKKVSLNISCQYVLINIGRNEGESLL